MSEPLPPLQPELEELDAIILGTDIKQAIQAASLALDGRKVLHLDKEPLYGQRHATRSLREMLQWSRGSVDLPEALKAHPRDWNLDQCPQLLPAAGDVVDLLIASEASSHVEFKLLHSAHILLPDATSPGSSPAQWIPVPSSKEAIFSSTLSLLEKRKLMRFLTSMTSSVTEEKEEDEASGSFRSWLTNRFGLSSRLADIVQYGVLMDGLSSPFSSDTLKVQEGRARAQTLIGSVGRYGASPFLFPMFGMGDVAQAFCRMAAVHGAIYVMQRQIGEIQEKDIWLPETRETLHAQRVLAHPDYLASRPGTTRTRRYLCILSMLDKFMPKGSEEEGEDEEDGMPVEEGMPMVFTLPPTSDHVPPVYVLSVGHAVQACPKGWLVWHMSFSSNNGSDQEDRLLFERSFKEVSRFHTSSPSDPDSATVTLTWLEDNIPGEDGPSPVLWSLSGKPLEQIEDLLHHPAFADLKREEEEEIDECEKDERGVEDAEKEGYKEKDEDGPLV